MVYLLASYNWLSFFQEDGDPEEDYEVRRGLNSINKTKKFQ